MFKHDDFLKQRFVDESNFKSSDIELSVQRQQKRSPFAKDKARVLHSAAFRKLADKTQVVSPNKNPVPRTRLTHSLEVGQISREIALELDLDPDLAEMSGFAHDIGHPPFGHNGENQLNKLSKNFGGFESNAQNLRILSKLEPKIYINNISYGLNLTRAALDATIKYPWEYDGKNRKFGVYEEEREIFNWVRKNNNTTNLSKIAEIMEWADDIAYSVHDVEDGLISKRINLKELNDLSSIKDLVKVGKLFYADLDENAVIDAANRLVKSDIVKNIINFDYSLDSYINLKKFTSYFVSRFSNAIVFLFKNPKVNNSNNVFLQISSEINVLKLLALKYIQLDYRHQAEQKIQQQIITAAFDILKKEAPKNLSPILFSLWNNSETENEKLRIIVDRIAEMTETEIKFFVS